MLPRRLLTALYFALSALALGEATTLGWGVADARDGSRYKIGPSSVVHVLFPHQTVSPTVVCVVDQRSQDPPPCELSLRGGDAARLLHAGELTMWIAVGAAALAALLALLPYALGRWSWVPGLGALLAIGYAVWALETQPPKALAAIVGLDYGIGGTKGMLEVAAALLLLTVAAVTGRAPFHPKRLAVELGLLGGLAALTLLALRFLYWPLVFGIVPPIVAAVYLYYLMRTGRHRTS